MNTKEPIKTFTLGRYRAEVFPPTSDLGYAIYISKDGSTFSGFWKDAEADVIAAAQQTLSDYYEMEDFSGMKQTDRETYDKVVEFYRTHELRQLLNLEFPEPGCFVTQCGKSITNIDAVGNCFVKDEFLENYQRPA
ncbi:MAG: hypothetical protein HWQ38_19150 [Nostoc sp. NMS7]|uniref:hypothetical protein n=1 Tax=Nostoc sp. NMS7 TaxID=2815391 RepID=UPI0025D9F58F|nr:hypothetical protein [Nostoc sp. NMS7]MBN3948454.1 hypothetical protein [Nostoc sp. NMS7]